MSVARLKDGRHLVRYRLNGKEIKEYFGRGIEAQKKAEQRNNDLKAQGTIHAYHKNPSMAAGVTFQELAVAYLDIKSRTDLTPSSTEALEYKLRIILAEIGHLQAAGITHKRLDDYVKKRLSTPRTVRTGSASDPILKPLKNPDGSTRYLTRSTVHRELCDIQAILNWAVSKKYLIANPVMGHKKPKLDNAIIKPPTLDETRAILAESAPHLIRALKISFYTGLRPGAQELFRLTWDDVDLVEKTIFIVSAKKNGIPSRTVPLHPDLIFDLLKWKTEDKRQRLSTQELITYKGNPIKSVKHAYTAAKRRAGITRRIRLYDFRHAACTNMLAAGGDLKSVSEIIGHSRTDTTTKIYQHTDIHLHRQQIDLIPSLNHPRPDRENKIINFKKKKKKGFGAHKIMTQGNTKKNK